MAGYLPRRFTCIGLMGLLWIVAGLPTASGAVVDGSTTIPECCLPKVARAPQAGVVLLRADECEASEKVAAVVSQAADILTSAPVLFVTLDFSSPRQSEQSELLAHGLGLEKVWSGFGKQTGFALVVDWTSRKAVAKITEFDNRDQLVRHVTDLLSAP